MIPENDEYYKIKSIIFKEKIKKLYNFYDKTGKIIIAEKKT